MSDGPNDRDWYKDAIIYELRVRSFFDDDGDGLGDFQGLTKKLDYLQDLGVTAIWLLPFYPSPLRDDGYDIAEYTEIHKEVGTMSDFKVFLREAHRRGLKVITELVLNHTSDQHPWFQRARRAAPGSSARDFYVWSDSPERYRDARIIFKDFEPSNWSWDPMAKAYFWHRFYAHQPDLNFDNPAVHKALVSVVDFWLKLGVDGLRLDAVPYLYEREGTSCENLPETHEFLKKLRKHVDAQFEGRMLLAEANQWPEDAVSYFGRGDECHMAFHFPIMPRIFMSIHMEDRFPITDILAQTPPLPPSCQWALFLRTHDALTLEMVPDEERDAMYRAYAHETTMRINLGIRRRLGPLLGNDRRKMELMNGLLFSLPGTPVLYYGDEIGMGDNVYLGDRNGVRTPMQWNPDKNAGFSRANPQRLVLPIIIDPEYHYESINVEAQQGNPNSLLWWTKRLIALRKRFKAFGRGSIEFLSPENPRVLAFVRQLGREVILVVANLSRHVQFVEMDLGKWRGSVPVELFGRTRFPAIGELPYLLTLGGHAFYWFSLEPAMAEDAPVGGVMLAPPVLETAGGMAALFETERAAFEGALPPWLAARRWFLGGGRPVLAVHVVERMTLTESPRIDVVLVRVEYAESDPETYALALGYATGPRVRELRARSPQAVIASLAPRDGAGEGAVFDVAYDAVTARALLEAVVRRRRVKTPAGEIVAAPTRPLELSAADVAGIEARVLREHRTSPVVFGERLLLKPLRKLDEGRSPALEVGLFLAAHAPEVRVPRIAGYVEWRRRGTEPVTLAILEAYVHNEGLAWTQATHELGRYFERALSRHGLEPPRPPGVLALGEGPPAVVAEVMGSYPDAARQLGRRVAELHVALASDPEDPAFAPEAHSTFDQRSIYQSMRNLTGRVLRSLRGRRRNLDPEAARDAERVLGSETVLLRRFVALMQRRLTAMRTRIHGELHLGQVLQAGSDFVIIDFEGDRSKPLAERRRKRSPLRDVAGMLRSFHVAAYRTLLEDTTAVRPDDRRRAEPWADLWQAWASAAFLSGYLDAAAGAPFLPREPRELAVLLDIFTMGEALDETGRELEAGSERVRVPLRALAQMLESGG